MKSTVIAVQLVGEKAAQGSALLEPVDDDSVPQFAIFFVRVDEQGS